MHTPSRLLLAPSLLLTLVACANGTDELMPGYYEEQAGGGGTVGGGEGGAGGVTSAASSSVSASASASSTGAGGAGGEGGEGSDVGEGGEGSGGGGEGGGEGAVPECDLDAPNTCERAEYLGVVSGDEDADSVTVTGTTSKWFEVYVADDSQIFTSNESFKATLTSPPGMNFDLIVYQGQLAVDGADPAPDCYASGVRALGSPESFMTTWNDRGGDEDGLWFSLEVRHVEGTVCDGSATWTLVVQGNPDG